MTNKNHNVRSRVALSLMGLVLASSGCNNYPVGPMGQLGPVTNSIPGEIPAGVTTNSSPQEDNDLSELFSYSESTPIDMRSVYELCNPKYIVGSQYQSDGQTLCAPDVPAVPAPTARPSARPTASPSPKASPSPSTGPNLPSGARPSVKPRGENVFWFRVTRYVSPNGDTIKDQTRIDVVASPDVGAWVLEVVGYPGTILAGSGYRLNYQWDVTVNRQPLPEGHYKLRLRSLSGAAPVQFADFIVDTTPPVISEATVRAIEKGPYIDDEKNYDIHYKMGLKVDNVESKDIDKSSANFSFTGCSFSQLNATQVEDGNSYTVKYKFNSGIPNGQMNYEASIADKAGNRGVLQRSFLEEQGQAAISPESFVISGWGDGAQWAANESDEALAYRVQDAGDLLSHVMTYINSLFHSTPNPGKVPVHYAKSGRPLTYDVYTASRTVYQLPVSIPATVKFISNQDQVVYASFDITIPPPLVQRVPVRNAITWDCLRNVGPLPTLGTQAPQSSYHVRITYGRHEQIPGLTKAKDLHPFKIANYDCVKTTDWSSYILDYSSIRPDMLAKLTHIMDGHILTGGNPSKSRFFAFDGSLSVTRTPAFANESVQIANGHAETSRLAEKDAHGNFKDPATGPIIYKIIQMGYGVLQKPQLVPIGTTGGFHPATKGVSAPVVFPNRQVIWVRNGTGGGPFTTLFPDGGTQEYYEDRIL